jgi:hypothetical protein
MVHFSSVKERAVEWGVGDLDTAVLLRSKYLTAAPTHDLTPLR